MSRTESTLTILLLGALLMSPTAVGLFGLQTEEFENRALAELPEIRMARLLDAEMYAQISDVLEDRLPARRIATQIDARLDASLFGDSPHSSVCLGREDWLFFRDSLVLPSRNERPVAELLSELGNIGRRLEASGRTLHVVLIPNKVSVYPEYATDAIHELASGGTLFREELQRRLQARPLPGFVDLTPVMTSARQQFDSLLFFPDDTHVTSFGAIVIARGITDALETGLWNEVEVLGPRHGERLGDLGRMAVVREPVPNAVYRLRRKGVALAQPELVPQPTGYRLEILRASSASQPMIEGRTLFLHDSSLDLPRIMLHPFFQEAHFLNWNSFDPERTAAMMVQSDRVVIQMIERDFYWRTDELLGSEEFQRALDEKLKR